MTPFILTEPDMASVERTRYEMYVRLLNNKAEASLLMRSENYTEEDLLKALDDLLHEQINTPIFVNDKYQVSKKDMDDIIHLSIKRLDKGVIRDWRDLQEIKNMLVGPENVGIEIFPAESQLVDSANQYHLWVFKDPTYRLPFGFNQRLVSSDELSNTKQRPRHG